MSATITGSDSWKKLERLAKKPFDLTREGALSDNGRITNMICNSCGLKMIYGTQRVEE